MKKIVVYSLLALALSACKRPESTEDSAAPTPAAEEGPTDHRASGLFAALPASADVDEARAVLGNRLYHDPALSGDGTLSCASCHDITAGGDDGNRTSVGINGQLGPINAPTTLNAGFHVAQFWDGRAADLQEQAAGPVANPIEMGADWDQVVAHLQTVPEYVAAFDALYDDGITVDNVTDAIATFEETLITPSRFDAWLAGNDEALTADELHGLDRFVAVGCPTCHNGVVLVGSTFQKMGLVNDYFALRGGEQTDADLGRFNVTGNEADRHMFKVPTLRNVALTAPYFHDGSVSELSEAVRIMAHVQLGQELSDDDIAAITTFLEALTGELSVEPLPPFETAAVPTEDAPAPTDDSTQPG